MKELNVVAGKWSFSEVREWIIHSNEGLTLLYCLSKSPFESKSILKINPLVKIDCSYQYLFPNSIRKGNTENTGYSTPLQGCCQGVLNPISAVVNIYMLMRSCWKYIDISSISCQGEGTQSIIQLRIKWSWMLFEVVNAQHDHWVVISVTSNIEFSLVILRAHLVPFVWPC